MNQQLIPAPDMLGVPIQPWLMIALLAATLALHWMFIGGAFGGTFIVLLNSLRGRSGGAEARTAASRSILVFLPFMLSMGVTLGIAPLLFVQVLYGQFFYPANVIISLWWLLIVPLVIANLYLFYHARKCLRTRQRLGPGTPLVIVLVFVVLAFILSSNMTLMQTPRAWAGVWKMAGLALFVDGAVVHRALFAISGFIAAGGLFVAMLAKTGAIKLDGPDAAADAGKIMRGALSVAFGGLLVQFLVGAGILATMPDLWKSHYGQAATTAAIVSMIHTAAFTLAARVRAKWPILVFAVTAFFASAVAIAFVRDALRQTAVEPYFTLSNATVNPQWGAFALFAAFLAGGIAAVVALLRLASQRA